MLLISDCIDAKSSRSSKYSPRRFCFSSVLLLEIDGAFWYPFWWLWNIFEFTKCCLLLPSKIFANKFLLIVKCMRERIIVIPVIWLSGSSRTKLTAVIIDAKVKGVNLRLRLSIFQFVQVPKIKLSVRKINWPQRMKVEIIVFFFQTKKWKIIFIGA